VSDASSVREGQLPGAAAPPVNPEIFRAYDVRGIPGTDFGTEFAGDLGRAYAAFIFANHGERRRPRRVGVGRDCRLTSDGLAAALREGLRSAGLDSVDLGVCPTPAVYFSLFDPELDLDGAIQVTGSHNPADHNGFKICVGQSTIQGEDIQELRRLIERADFPVGTGREEGVNIAERYRDYMIRHVAPLPRPIRVVVDAGNATAGPLAPAIYRAIGCEVEELYCTMDGRFPNHHPDPTEVHNLSDLIARVAASDAELGIAFDGDADRIGVVAPDGRIVWGDEMMILFARDLLARSPGATVVSEVKCSQRLYDDIERQGGKAIMWRAGHSPIKAKMREVGAALGGEMSGHIFFADRYFGFDDAIYAGCRLLEILARSSRGIADLLADLPPTFTTPEIRIECPDAIKFEVVRRATERLRRDHEIVDVDGVRAKLPHGWGLIRASNTQPVLVLRCEATSAAELEAYRRRFEDLVADIRGELAAA
jgi:phosphomannomutase/phosphoglucomutase